MRSIGGGHEEAATVDVSAGLIGLRHVETPEYPELGRHRRTDEFYIENWSIGLDVSILAASASDLAWRLLRRARASEPVARRRSDRRRPSPRHRRRRGHDA